MPRMVLIGPRNPILCCLPSPLPQNGQLPPHPYTNLSASTGYQPDGLTRDNHVSPSTAGTTTSSLSSDPTVLAAEIISLRAQLALAVITPPATTGRHKGVLLDAWQQQQCPPHQCLLQECPSTWPSNRCHESQSDGWQLAPTRSPT